jgi:6-phosphogluconolactonase/glucosamine-6-phosphate isomerase/deaminase
MTIQFKNEYIPEGAQELAERILSYLNEGKRVLWLVCGGSNIPVSVEVLNIIKTAAGRVRGGMPQLTTYVKASRKLTNFHGEDNTPNERVDVGVSTGVEENLDVNGEYLTPINLKDLTVTLTDERYSSINHPDSNWRHLKEGGFDFDAVTAIPVLIGKSFEETTKMYGVNLRDAWSNNDVVIGQFGIGEDGHIAGVLPRTVGVRSPGTVVSYEAGKFRRLTMTLATIAKLDYAYVFAYGESKKEAVNNLKEELTLEAQPAQILKKVKKVVVYSDQVV